MSAINTARNKYFAEGGRNSIIFTPPPVCAWLYEILKPELETVSVIIDPACGSGNLLAPFENVVKLGIDIEDFGVEGLEAFWKEDFLSIREQLPGVDLVVMNPPYNHTKDSARKWGKNNLLPELFVNKAFSLFGREVKMVVFTPMGLRLNTRCYTPKQGDRYKLMRDKWPQITSIVSLPLDMFPNPDFDPDKAEERRNPQKGIMQSNIKRKETQQEILFFNMPKLLPHYCLPESVLQELREMDYEVWG